ncbi:MAG: CapA family protein [Candidatus Lambdaproteobacteria bacterium]|nr:CapA family protein [Candidatus Lambdaproteobacteria bacterium]
MAANSWNIVLAGECMASRPFSKCEDPDFLKVIEKLRSSDLTYAHLEMNFADFHELEWPVRGDWVASFMIADAEVADDFRWAGVDMLSLAHNHSFDWGPAGILSTIRHCRRAGIACAGTGRDLEEAREPGYRETKKGRAALIAVSSGNKGFEWAGQPKATLRGRPGVNPLRVEMKYEVPAEALEQLQRIAKELGIVHNGLDKAPGELRLQLPQLASNRNVPVFKAGKEFRVRSTCNRKDLAGISRSVDEAMQMADMVIVAQHFNVADGARGDSPPAFVQEFARACIDSGADIYVGHGWHKTLGIEIYKGKPIFYGLGNFFAQSEFVRRVPADSYESWGHDMDNLPTLTPAAEPLHPGLVAPTWWSTVLFQLRMENHRVREIKLFPVEMGRDSAVAGKIKRTTGSGAHAKTEGRPHLADEVAGRPILQRMKDVCVQHGTTVEIEGNVGIVRL